MVTAAEIIALGRTLPRAEQAHVRDRVKFRVRGIVFVSISPDETSMGFGFPKHERDALIASDPDTFFLPIPSDLRFNWVCARLAELDAAEMRELVLDAWQLVAGKKVVKAYWDEHRLAAYDPLMTEPTTPPMPAHPTTARPTTAQLPSDPEVMQVETPHGPARVHLYCPVAAPTGLLMLGAGASGGVTAGDLQAATAGALQAGMAAALIEQPYRVAGRRAPAPAPQVDTAWIVVAEQLSNEFGEVPLITGGRSFGGRVACRTSAATGSAGVLCLAFPTHPPGRPEKSRQAELSGVTVPTLVVQGEGDPFGIPEGSDSCRIVVVAGDHSLKKDLPLIRAAIADWLPSVLGR